jgi:hypothetical protein
MEQEQKKMVMEKENVYEIDVVVSMEKCYFYIIIIIINTSIGFQVMCHYFMNR